jgi:predicted phage terminase large subunit-like protein
MDPHNNGGVDLTDDLIWDAALQDANENLDWYGELAWRDDKGEPLQPARHHQVWLAALQDESCQRLLIVAPPEHAKTVWCSQVYPAWRIGRDPNLHFLHVSVTATLAKLNSVAVRDTTIGNELHKMVFPNLSADRIKGWGEAEWFLQRENKGDKDATFAAAGFDGPIIGRRAHIILVDDPHSEDTAMSPTYRERTKRRFRRQVMSRLSSDGRAVVVTTRWHHDDLAADLIRDRDGDWLIIHTPALGDEAGSFALILSWDRERIEAFSGRLAELGFEVGGVGAPPDDWGYPREISCARVTIHRDTKALWPERWPERALERRKKDVGAMAWHTMYQGKGTPPEGKIFKGADFRYYEDAGDYWILHPGGDKAPYKVPKDDMVRKIQYVDTAATEETKSDYFADGTFGLLKGGEVLWLDLHHDKYEVPKQPGVLEAQFFKHWPELIRLEAKAAGLALFQTLVVSSGLPVLPDKPDVSKLARASSAAVYYQQHRVYHRIGAPWLSVAEDELLGFPDEAPHDDIVDVVTGALKELMLGSGAPADDDYEEDDSYN